MNTGGGFRFRKGSVVRSELLLAVSLVSGDASPGQPRTQLLGLRPRPGISELPAGFSSQLMARGVFPVWNSPWCMVGSAGQL